MNALDRAAREVAAADEERRLGPKDCAQCPDCMALLRGEINDAGRLTLFFVKHADVPSPPQPPMGKDMP